MDTTVTFQVPHSAHGDIIGRRAKIKKQLQTEFSVTILTPKMSDTSNNSVTIKGSDEAIQQAKEAMELLLGFTIGTDPLLSVVVSVPVDRQLELIGRGGSVLKRMEKETNCNVEIPSKKSQSTNVVLEGTKEDVLKAQEFIGSLLGIDILVVSGLDGDAPETKEVTEEETKEAVEEMNEEPEEETVSVVPTAEELNDLSQACSRLWQLDENRLRPGKDYKIHLQSGKRMYDRGDFAEQKLFTGVKNEVWKRPTFRSFYYLLDNYEASTGQAEVVTKEEIRENWCFINQICQTPVMQYCHKYLASKKLTSRNERTFKKLLYDIWFSLYRRQTNNDSSGFEHVFVGEEKRGKIIGFHNWIQFFVEENKGAVDYQGFVLPKCRGRYHGQKVATEDQQLISVQFAWGDEMKDVSSIFIGTSPEFEMALFTLCFLCGEEDNFVQVGPYAVNIKCYKINTRKGTFIGTTFPIAVED